jgi:Cu/Ag efflux protein CusF
MKNLLSFAKVIETSLPLVKGFSLLMRRSVIYRLGMSFVLLGVLFLTVLTLAPPAEPAAPCCAITAIDAKNGVVTAKETATGRSFEFKVTDAKLLSSLKVGQPVYANFQTKSVSLDGQRACPCIIQSISVAGSPSITPCCAITAIDAKTQMVIAADNATGRSFRFKVTDRAQLNTLTAGEKLFVNFDALNAHRQRTTAISAILNLTENLFIPSSFPSGSGASAPSPSANNTDVEFVMVSCRGFAMASVTIPTGLSSSQVTLVQFTELAGRMHPLTANPYACGEGWQPYYGPFGGSSAPLACNWVPGAPLSTVISASCTTCFPVGAEYEAYWIAYVQSSTSPTALQFPPNPFNQECPRKP